MRVVQSIGGWVAAVAVATTGFFVVGEAAVSAEGDGSSRCVTPELDGLREWSVATAGDVSLSNASVRGRVVAGGDVALTRWEIGKALERDASRVDLMVGGDLAAENGRTHRGSITVAGEWSESVPTPNGSITQAPLAVDVEGSMAGLQLSVQQWALAPATGSVSNSDSRAVTLRLEGDEPDVNVFRLSAAELQTANAVQIRVPEGSSTMVVVSGEAFSTDVAGLSSVEVWRNRSYRKLDQSPAKAVDVEFRSKLLWVFPDATEVEVGPKSAWEGTIVAPNANVSLTSPMRINGSVFAESLTGSGTVANFPVAADVCVPLFANSVGSSAVSPVTDLSGTDLFDELRSSSPLRDVGFKGRMTGFECLAELPAEEPEIDRALQRLAAGVTFLQGDGAGDVEAFLADRDAVIDLLAFADRTGGSEAASCAVEMLTLADRVMAVRAVRMLSALVDESADAVPSATILSRTVLANAEQLITTGDSDFDASSFVAAIDNYTAAWQAASDEFAALWLLQDPDQDLIRNETEIELGLSSQSDDTDGDGLSDLTELWTTATDPALADTDGDGIRDGESDPDQDGLTHLEELGYKTLPLDPDTDSDGVNDGDEIAAGTDPLSNDSDDDGLTDDSEAEVGTDLFNPDTDGDGILDGDETYTTTASFADVAAGLTVAMTGVGDVADRVVAREFTDLPLYTELPGLVSGIVDLQTDAAFDTAEITFNFDPATVPNGDLAGLAVMWFDEVAGTWVALGNANVDTTTGTITATADHFTVFAVFHIPTWEAVFTAWDPTGGTSTGNAGDGDDGTPNDTTTAVDVSIVIDSSGSMRSNDPSRLRVTAAQQFIDALIDGDRVGVVDFTYSSRTLSSLTTDLAAARQAVTYVRQSGGTNIGAGVSGGLNQLTQAADREGKAQLLILLTDGVGGWNPALIDIAVDNDIAIYTIGLGRGVDTALLQGIADATGGQYFPVATAADLPDVFSRITDIPDIGGDGGDGRPEDLDPQGDEDEDGITNGLEINGVVVGSGRQIITDPFNRDTDGDGLEDGDELILPSGPYSYWFMRTDPTDPDSDGDLLDDGIEVLIDADPNDPDMDGDLLLDGQEFNKDFDPFDANPDGDSLDDFAESAQQSDPFIYDLTGQDAVMAFIAGGFLGELGSEIPSFESVAIKDMAEALVDIAPEIPYLSDAVGGLADFLGEAVAGLSCGVAKVFGFLAAGPKVICEVLKFQVRWNQSWVTHLAYFGGSITVALIPILDIIAGIRDTIGNLVKGQWLGAGLEAIFTIIGIAPGIGDAPKIVKRTLAFLETTADAPRIAFRFLGGKIGNTDIFQTVVKQLTNLSDDAIQTVGGLTAVKRLSDLGVDLRKIPDRLNVCKLASPNSIDIDELVVMADGTTQALGDVEIGDQVRSFDPVSQATSVGTVLDTTRRQHVGEVIDIGVTGGTDTLTFTGNHEIWSDEYSDYIEAGLLEFGVMLDNTADTSINSFETRDATVTVGDLDVDGPDTFTLATGDTTVVVHNANICSLEPLVDFAMRKLQRSRHYKARVIGDDTARNVLTNQRFRQVRPPKPGAFRNATDAEKFVGGAIDARKADIDDWLNKPTLSVDGKPINKTLTVDVDDFGEGVTTGKVLIDRSTGQIVDATGVRITLVRKGDRFEIASAYPRIPVDLPDVTKLVNQGDQSAIGGVYRLIDTNTGDVVRTGRTDDIVRRRGEHAIEFPDANLEVVYGTDVYAEQRGLEQFLHDASNAPLNRVEPIGISNPRRAEYLESAEQALAGL